jgi:hypothetical protein
VPMKRALLEEVKCLACGDGCKGVVLISLASVVSAGGPGHVELCFDCVNDMANVALTSGFNAKVNDNAQGNLALGGEGVVLGLGSSVVSDSSPGPRSRSGARARRARAKGVYTPAFERLWAGCGGKKGNKEPAAQAFDELNLSVTEVENVVTLAITRWALWMKTDSWSRGFSKHMSTWLRALGFDDEPDPSEFRPTGGSVTAIGHHRAEVKPRPSGEVKL